jgi:hypothetical protein
LTPRTVRILDALVAFWVVAWVVLALFVARGIRDLRDLSTTVAEAGIAIEATGRAVESLAGLPYVGDDIEQAGGRTAEAGRSAQESGRSSRESTETLSILLGLAIALVPTVPVLTLYAPVRIRRIRDVHAVGRVLAASGGDPTFEEFLARRAAQRLPYHRLREVSANPWRDLDAGRYSELAKVELQHLGLETSALRREPRTRA